MYKPDFKNEEQLLRLQNQLYLNAFFLKLAEAYPPNAKEWQDKSKGEQLERYRDYFLRDEVLRFLRFNDNPQLLNKPELEQLFFQTRLIPPTVNWFPSSLNSLRGILDYLLQDGNATSEDIWKHLYVAEKRMQKEQRTTAISRQLIRNYLDSYVHQQLSRLNAGRRRRLQWGEELEIYYVVLIWLSDAL